MKSILLHASALLLDTWSEPLLNQVVLHSFLDMTLPREVDPVEHLLHPRPEMPSSLATHHYNYNTL
jgi:hypothetical protein